MARYVDVIAQHQLDFENMDIMLEQIAKAFNVNVEYAFSCYTDLDTAFQATEWGYIPPKDTNCLTIKKVTLKKGLQNVVLLQRNYIQLYKTYGEKAAELPEFRKRWGNNVEKNLKMIEDYNNRPIVFNLYMNGIDFTITKGCILSSYALAWWGLFNVVLGDDYSAEEILLDMNPFRFVAQKLGAQYAWYICDEPNEYLGILYSTMAWKEIENIIYEKVGKDKIVDIRKCLHEEKYKKDINSIVQKNIYAHPIFYDSFEDYRM